jgi:signal transduction histidine kinase
LNWTDEVFQIHELPQDYQVDFTKALSFYQEDSIQKIKDTVKQITNNGGKDDLELEMTTSRGRRIWVRITFAARVENGQTAGLYGIIQDITEDKNIESLREDMERINRHDLKIPLNSIYIAAQLLDKKKTEDDYRKIADIIKTSTYRLMDMINLSLSIYKIEEGAYKLSSSPFNLAEVLKRIIKEQLPIVEFDLKIDPGSFSEEKAFIINGEESLIYSMLCNLLKNAVDASSIDEKIKINLRNRGEVCVLEIKNRRVIPDELRDCFFSKYTTSGKKGGVGLGTYGAKLIAELHRGDILMISSDEQGTVVTVELPYDAETVINLEEML